MRSDEHECTFLSQEGVVVTFKRVSSISMEAHFRLENDDLFLNVGLGSQLCISTKVPASQILPFGSSHASQEGNTRSSTAAGTGTDSSTVEWWSTASVLSFNRNSGAIRAALVECSHGRVCKHVISIYTCIIHVHLYAYK